MDLLYNDLVVEGLVLFSGLVSTLFVAAKVPFPNKFPLLIAFGTVFIDGLLNFLYQLGGRYIVLFPVLFWSKTVRETTGVLGLLVGSYSFLNKDTISAHWYSLPTGCSPLAMASQYIPPQVIQAVLTGFFLLVSVANNARGNLEGSRRKILLPIFVLFVVTLLELQFHLGRPYRIGVALTTLLATKLIADGDASLSIGKKKIL